METTCGATDLPRLSDRDWSKADIAAFVARARKGTVAVDNAERATRMLPECKLPGTYESYDGKAGGRLWATNRPLLRTEEVDTACAQATHLVATYATNGSRFGAVLVPLPCPPTADPRPAKGCVGRGLTGPERLRRGEALQEEIEPGRHSLDLPSKRSHLAPDWSQAGPPRIPRAGENGPNRFSNGWLLKMWALTPDEFPATRWLGQLSDDCALSEQGIWLNSAYAWAGSQEDRHTVVISNPTPPTIRANDLSLTSCLSRPVFPHCFPDIAQIDPGCMRTTY